MLGEVFWLDVAYEDAPDESKRRPVIIVAKAENEFLILVATTSVPPHDPPKYHDRYKIPIVNWRRAGLFEPTWGLGFRLLELSREQLKSLVTDKDFMGTIPKTDFNFLIQQIESIHSKD
nr:type II toxin-antitoxin system PemK/MazF family toxin [Acididesulfobacillus acetoxydans]